MLLLEGFKDTKELINQALSDPDITFGFETEFYVRGGMPIVKKHLLQGAKAESGSDWMVKPLSVLSWSDILTYFHPLAVTKDQGDDNQDIMRGRLNTVFERKFPDDAEKIKKPRDQYEMLRSRFKPYHLITLLRIYPNNGFTVDKATQGVLQNIIRNGNLMKITAYKNLDNEGFRLFERGEENLVLNPQMDLNALEVFYELVADILSNELESEVRVVMNKTDTFSRSESYQTWVLMPDDSLAVANEEGDIGMELVSPVFQIGKGIQMMQRVMQLIQNFPLPNSKAFTNEKTGFHMNVGSRIGRIDYTKLLFLLGDEYVAKNYDRLQHVSDRGDVYAAQTYQQMVDAFQHNKPQLLKILGMLQRGITLSRQDINYIIDSFRKSIPVGKMNSVNLSKLDQGYIEVRSPGNAGYEKDVARLVQTAQHLAVMILVATDPDVGRREFLKKLYTAAINAGKRYYEKQNAANVLKGQPAQAPRTA